VVVINAPPLHLPLLPPLTIAKIVKQSPVPAHAPNVRANAHPPLVHPVIIVRNVKQSPVPAHAPNVNVNAPHLHHPQLLPVKI